MLWQHHYENCSTYRCADILYIFVLIVATPVATPDSIRFYSRSIYDVVD